MEPLDFKQKNITYAKNQKEYLPLPAHKTDDGIVTTCWRLSFFERLKTLFSGKIFISTMTFNEPLQPQKAQTYFEDFTQ